MNNNLQFNIRLLLDEEVREIQYNQEQRTLCATLKIERLLSRSRSIYNLPDIEFRKSYRMNKATLERIIEELTPFLKINRRSDGISVESKVSSAVRFLAQGAYQRGVGKETNIGLSQPSVSRVLNEVIDCINLHLLHKFRTRFHIPGVIGVIDGSQIGIFPPSTNHNQYPEFVYVNRKGFHSINTQLIVDHTYRILNVNAKFPGSTHDSHIWKMSLVRNHLSNTYRRDHEWLLGDSGYPLEPWLLTPFNNPGDGSPESRFNVKFTSARSVVERAIGMLKGRWRCLCKQRMLHYKPTIASKIINACAVFHNICIDNFDAVGEDEEYDEPYNANDLIHFPAGNALHTEGNNNRSEIMDYINRVQ
ncbi:putative nuclease HARBI1 [Acyrthosiphon pisum]|uniref:DDE Tnp4 domain-containing protein n=1 Tax=Acyrthosiphon pisum TaxID=7029 RepID=A0A8R2JXD3_ACYPI|nr:putative nuclease HARBI1 [Acyrthosiphon pisum]